MVRVENITYSWPGAAAPALRGVDFSAAPGDIICLAGCNGSGKSTLLLLLAGLLEQDSGSIGIAVQGHRRAASLLLQDADMQILGSTVAEDMLLHWPKPDAGRVVEARQLAERLDLLHQWDASVHTLSYGQKRKLCLASALLSEPATLLLDEPFSGLDYPGMCELREILMANQKQGLVQIVSTHDLEPLIDLTASLLVLHRGEQVFYGAPEAGLNALAGHAEWGLRPPCSWQRERSIASWVTDTGKAARGTIE